MASNSDAPSGSTKPGDTRATAGLGSLFQWSAMSAQLVVGLAAAAVLGIATGSMELALSAAYGALAAWLPALLSARVAARTIRLRLGARKVLVALFVIEGVKIMLTVVLLLAATSVVAQVNWPALLAGFVVTIKAAWAVLWWISKKGLRVAKR